MRPLTKTWLAVHLYYAEPWEEFLTRAVRPLVETVLTQKLAEQFFFIRYRERGPHIRLRFKGERDVLQQVLKPELASFFCAYFEQNPSQRIEPTWTLDVPAERRWFPNNSVQFIPYEPEIERYGGPAGVLIAEKQFETSSRTVLTILEQSDNWDYERALGAAIQLHLGLASALGMDLAETRRFYAHIFKGWFARAWGFAPNMSAAEKENRQGLTLRAFAENFAKQEPVLVPYHKTLWNALQAGTEFEQEWLNVWLRRMVLIGLELKDAQRENRLTLPEWFEPNPTINISKASQELWPIVGSYVHMTNNRLGILNRDEAYLGYLIKQSLENL